MAKYPIVEKAWSINKSNLSEPWFCNDDIVYYGTRGEAKRRAVVDNDMEKVESGEYLNYLNVRVKRVPECDKILVDGNIVKRYELKTIDRNNRIKELDPTKMYYVQDRRNYVGNAVLWWAKDGRGYVTDLSKAHKHTYEEILKFNPRGTDIIWEAGHVENAIRSYVDAQYLSKEFSV